MWCSGIRHYRTLIGLLGVVSVMLGCASIPGGHDTYTAEGFRIALPQTGTKAIVKGNHSEAVNRAIPWLNDHQLLVVNRWIEKEPATPEMALGDSTELQAPVRALAHKVGATLVVFVHVDENLVNHTDPTSGEQHPLKMIGIEIQGINVETGKMAFGAMAWNSEPLKDSKKVVQDLTVLALEKSWQEPDASLAHQQEVTPKIKTDRKAPLITSVTAESPGAPDVAQPMTVESTATSREQVKVFIEPVPEGVPSAPVVTEPVPAESSGTSEDPSLGLQVASGALSILYTPLKVVYAGLGGLVGCFAYAVTAGNEQVAQSVWDASLRGTYWLTSDHLQGNEPIRFKGEPAH